MRPAFKRLKRRQTPLQAREEEILKSFQFLHSDEEENSAGPSSEDMGDFIVEDHEDASQILRDSGVMVDTKDALQVAFGFLRVGDFDSFCAAEIIQRMFAPAYHLLASFGPGSVVMKQIWDRKWRVGVISTVIPIYKGCCEACRRQRMLGYRVFATIQGEAKAFDIGTDCYEVKLSPLFALVNFSLRNAHCNDVEHLQRGLEEKLEVIKEAPTRMARLYAYL
jgi:hypothetical protein